MCCVAQWQKPNGIGTLFEFLMLSMVESIMMTNIELYIVCILCIHHSLKEWNMFQCSYVRSLKLNATCDSNWSSLSILIPYIFLHIYVSSHISKNNRIFLSPHHAHCTLCNHWMELYLYLLCLIWNFDFCGSSENGNPFEIIVDICALCIHVQNRCYCGGRISHFHFHCVPGSWFVWYRKSMEKWFNLPHFLYFHIWR